MSAPAYNALRALYWLPLGLVFTQKFYTVRYIRGKSMQPTLNPEPLLWDDLVVFNRHSIILSHDYRRGDIVSLTSPVDPKQTIVKRIVALEGDTVQTLPPYPDHEVVVPEGHAWIEGDESFRTWDSNRWGPVPLGLIDAKLTYILWPPSRFGPISSPGASAPQKKNGLSRRQTSADVEREKWRQSRVRRIAEQ